MVERLLSLKTASELQLDFAVNEDVRRGARFRLPERLAPKGPEPEENPKALVARIRAKLAKLQDKLEHGDREAIETFRLHVAQHLLEFALIPAVHDRWYERRQARIEREVEMAQYGWAINQAFQLMAMEQSNSVVATHQVTSLAPLPRVFARRAILPVWYVYQIDPGGDILLDEFPTREEAESYRRGVAARYIPKVMRPVEACPILRVVEE